MSRISQIFHPASAPAAPKEPAAATEAQNYFSESYRGHFRDLLKETLSDESFKDLIARRGTLANIADRLIDQLPDQIQDAAKSAVDVASKQVNAVRTTLSSIISRLCPPSFTAAKSDAPPSADKAASNPVAETASSGSAPQPSGSD